MSTPLTLAAVVVTFNRAEKLKATVSALLSEALDHLIVVDNGSTDGTRDWLAACDDPRLTVVLSERNIGGAGGFETGMRRAVEAHDPDWIVVMDDDGRPEPGTFAAFRAMDHGNWDAIAAAVRYPSGEICDMNRPVLNPFWHIGTFLSTALGGGRAAFHLKDPDFAGTETILVDGASFVGLFLSRDAIARAGFPDGRLFVYGDDGLYTLGLTRKGGRIGFAPSLRFEHDCSTFVSNDHRFRPMWKVYYYHRNLLFLYRAAAGIFFWPALLVILPKWALKARHQGEERGDYLRLLRMAVVDGLLGRRRRIEETPS